VMDLDREVREKQSLAGLWSGNKMPEVLKKGILGIRESVVATINSTQPLVMEV